MVYERQATVNTIVLADLLMTLGVVLNDVIVDLSHILRRLHERGSIGNIEFAMSIIAEAATESRSAMIYVTLIIIAASPIFYLSGLLVSFFNSLAFTYTLAVIVSIAVGILVTPALPLIFLAGINAGGRVSSFAERHQLAHKRRLELLIQHARPLLIFQPQPISLLQIQIFYQVQLL